MGLLYTKFHMDFDEPEWKQISHNPVVFQTQKDNVVLEVEDTSQKLSKLIFKKGSKFHMFRVTGKFRLTWDNDDIVQN
jgi:pyoverdine/dityrosine biosynthesis protein Dit1